MPVPMAGVKPRIGNRNPVTLVRMVVSRKNAVHPGIRFERNMPTSTTMPLAIASKLMMTWMRVKV
jgi:hypothetical protein